MTDPEHGRRTATRHQRRPAENYCAYCGRKCSNREDATTGATDATGGVRDRPFCDADCERAWNIDASKTPARP